MGRRFEPAKPRADIRRVVERVPIVRQCWRAIQTMVGWGTVRRRAGEAGRQWSQVTRGDHEIYGDAFIAEPQGFTSGVSPGAIGVVIKPGGRGERVIVINPSRYQQRPRYVDDDAACVYTPHQSRLFLDQHGDVELGAGLSDYRDTADFLDEGAKVRLRHDGELEIYAETEIKLRCQAAGGEGTSATIVFRPDGTLEVTADADVSVVAAGSVTVSAEQSVTVDALGDVEVVAGGSVEVEADGDVRLQAAGNITLVPTGGGQVRLGGDAGLQALALASKLQTQLDVIINAVEKHVHPGNGAPASLVPLVIPVPKHPFAAANAWAKE